MSDIAKDDASYQPDEKKVWSFIHIAPDPFKENHIYVIQELDGAFIDGEWVPAKIPASRRVVKMMMKDNGSLVNVYSAYNGNRNSQR
jgi:hypothetical protein